MAGVCTGSSPWAPRRARPPAVPTQTSPSVRSSTAYVLCRLRARSPGQRRTCPSRQRSSPSCVVMTWTAPSRPASRRRMAGSSVRPDAGTARGIRRNPSSRHRNSPWLPPTQSPPAASSSRAMGAPTRPCSAPRVCQRPAASWSRFPARSKPPPLYATQIAPSRVCRRSMARGTPEAGAGNGTCRGGSVMSVKPVSWPSRTVPSRSSSTALTSSSSRPVVASRPWSARETSLLTPRMPVNQTRPSRSQRMSVAPGAMRPLSGPMGSRTPSRPR